MRAPGQGVLRDRHGLHAAPNCRKQIERCGQPKGGLKAVPPRDAGGDLEVAIDPTRVDVGAAASHMLAQPVGGGS